ncbi:ABC transporter substrate-binding protein [Paenibacillus sp. NEAU-GSW1]|uniref:ABC transporter substrate-binding protein n=1 Tax=Paenibacillus sp. NEAU-GSW1 TaxID=2682486 RepID=UPI001C12ABE9|nr:extracellular solute-binding protein [Paenibacillus sp. NEAU-GSW1]
MNMKRVWSMALVIGIAGGLLGACGNSNSKEEAQVNSSAGTEKKKNVTLSYLASQDWIKDPEMKLAEKFEEQTGIHIDYQIVPSDQYNNVLKAKLASGEALDIFGGQSGKFDLGPLYDVENNAVDLTNEEWVKREDPLFIEQATWNSKVYALTIWDPSSSWIIVYNKKIFDQLGLDVPKSYADFLQDCEKIKAAGITPIYEPVSDGWHHVLWFPELGVRYEEQDPGLAEKLINNKEKFEDAAVLEQSLTQLNELVQKGYFGDNAFSNTYADTEKNMASGKYAMTVYNIGLPAQIEKSVSGSSASDYGFFPIPLNDNQNLNVNPAAPSKFISSNSKHIEEAKQYFAFLTEQENLQFLLDNEPKFTNLNFSGVTAKFNEEQKAFFDSYGKKTGAVYQTAINYLNPQWMDIGKDMSAMMGKQMTVKDVLKNIDKRREQQAKTAKDSNW